ncbi:MAG: tetratricopeptide repeat protein [Acidobacteriota bacterium]|nr:tetratricopeptide repeat protein [Acidobacteriota bacterium]
MNPGDSLGPYRIQNPLGAGGMGLVYRARDTRLNREVALKQLSDPSLASTVARARVLQEARTAAGLSHPNIATIYDVLDTGDGPIIVMEYVPGESLARHVARGSMAPARALDLAAQIADGLAEAHARGIVHRDLKPANIQITPEGKAKILDFGIAQPAASGHDQGTTPTVTAYTDAGRLAGTPGYMAPEQLGGARADERTDIYSLGVLLYEMLTGRPPYPAGDLLTTAMAVLKGDAPPVAAIVPATPPVVSAIVQRAMARAPDGRFQTASDLSRALRAALEEPSAGQVAMPSRAERRPRVPVSVVALLAASVLAGLGWQWTRWPDRSVVSAHSSSLAVLPFRNTSADLLTDPIAVGLTDAVANRLSSLQSVRLLSLDQTREAVGTGADAAAVANALGAGFVVEGAVRRDGQTLDVDVALVGVDGRRREAGRFTGDIAQIFDLHQRIAQGVITALAAANAVSSGAAPSPAPTMNQEAYAEYAQARLFLERPDDVDHAVRLFESAIAKDRRFALAHAGLGQAYWSKYRQTQDPLWTTKATTAILDALRIDPNQPEVRLSLAVMYQGLGRLDAAEEELRRVLALQPWNDDAHRLMAGVHIDRSEWDAAVPQLVRAIELRPNYWRNHSELGFTHYQAGRYDDAVKAYTRVVELQPDSALGYHMLGTVHQSAGQLPKALTNYTKAGAIRPRATTYSNIGTIHFWDGDYERAADAYRRALALTPASPGLHANLGDTLQKLGQRANAHASYEQAVREVRGLLAVNAKDAQNVARLGLYLAKLEDRAGADGAITSALALNAADGQVMYHAALVDALAGRQAAACGRLGEALALGASAEIARRADELRQLEGCGAYDRAVSGR